MLSTIRYSVKSVKNTTAIRHLQTDCKTVRNSAINECKQHFHNTNQLSIISPIQKLYYIKKLNFSTNNENEGKELKESLIYDGPFKDLTLKLKRISVTTCAIGFVGVPMIVYAQGTISASMSLTAQIAVAGTTMLAACGSTIALSYCFSPYVHTLKNYKDEVNENEKSDKENSELLQAITCNIVGMKVETIFNPNTDITSPNKRPFCNFIAKGMPMYIHPELIEDDKLRRQLFLDAADTLPKKGDDAKKDDTADKKVKKDDDDFII